MTVHNLTEDDDVFSADSGGFTSEGVEVNGGGGANFRATEEPVELPRASSRYG